MCGRFVASNAPAALADFFGADPPTVDLAPAYNVAPTNDVYGVVATSNGVRSIEVFRWGLLPSWAKDRTVGSSMINARAETLAEKRSFSPSFRRRRLLVPMTGFYEWKAGSAPRAAKTPMFIHSADDTPLAVAGVWSAWRDPSAPPDAAGEWLHTCSIITVAANATMAPIHDRMPAILERSAWDEWLDPTNDHLDALSSLLRPAPDGLLVMHRVSTLVNKVQNKGADLVLPVDEPEEDQPGEPSHPMAVGGGSGRS